LSQSWKGIIKH